MLGLGSLPSSLEPFLGEQEVWVAYLRSNHSGVGRRTGHFQTSACATHPLHFFGHIVIDRSWRQLIVERSLDKIVFLIQIVSAKNIFSIHDMAELHMH